MQLRLNEQEVVDGICIFVANEAHGRPEDADVEELLAFDNGEIKVKAKINGRTFRLDSEDVLEGIFQFLEGVHNMNREVMVGNLSYSKQEGFFVNVSVNE